MTEEWKDRTINTIYRNMPEGANREETEEIS